MDPRELDKWPVWHVKNLAHIAKMWLDRNKGILWSSTQKIGFKAFKYNVRERDAEWGEEWEAESHVIWCKSNDVFKQALREAFLNAEGSLIFTPESSELLMEASGQLLMF